MSLAYGSTYQARKIDGSLVDFLDGYERGERPKELNFNVGSASE